MNAACYDIAVVGAGPAGAMAARLCVAAGRRVVLIERETLPRYKTCGGGVVPRAAELMGIDITPAIERTCRRIELYVPGLPPQTAQHGDDPLIHMTMRDTLDALLTQAAASAGAELRTACRVTGVTEHDDYITLSTGQGDIDARYVLAADGARSNIAKLAGWPETRQFAPAVEWEVHASEADMQRFSAAVRFDFDFIRSGYAWVFPKRHHLSIGLGRLRHTTADENLNAAAARYLQALGIDADTPMQRHGYVVPITPRTDAIARRRILLLGDAAGLADPVAAEGITHAILSAQHAAEAVTAHRDPASAYTQLIGQQLMPELRAAKILSRLLYEHRLLRTMVLRLQRRRAVEAMVDVFTGRRTFSDVLAHRSRFLRYLLSRAA
ncbi:geranylgeranyl reductase family protein [Planctomycetales bacterium ZRK34]|nr:geranylgeranyl reductase family protein [Planctomycetales bacterium ZRK34]